TVAALSGLGILMPIARGAEAPSFYVGTATCARCHAKIHREWSGARHGKMLQPATQASVEGNFRRGRIALRGAEYRLRTANGAFYIAKAGEKEYHVDYTLGSRRIQHYLSTLPDGRIIVLPPSWDVARKEWFHNLDIVNPEEADDSPVQVWN